MTRRIVSMCVIAGAWMGAGGVVCADSAFKLALGPADGLLLGNPTAVIALEDPSNPGVVVGPVFFNTFVLDTAANGILFAQRAYLDDFFEPDPDLYEVAQNSGSDVEYLEAGTGGSALLDVFIEYNVYIQGTSVGSTDFLAGALRPFGSPDVDLFDVAGLAGMPVMINHDLRVNLRGLVNVDADFAMTTTFDSVPGAVGTTYTIPLTRLEAVHTGQQDPTDPVPSFEDIPMIEGVTFTHEGVSASVTTIVDTGASVTFLSTATVLSMGIDPETDAIDFIEIGGLGGSILAPVVHVGSMSIPTDQGVDLVFNEMDVIVIDIEGVDAVLGLDALTGGYNGPQLDAVFAWLLGEEPTGEYGYFSDMMFDFVGPEWSMRLDVNPAFHNMTLVGDTDGDLDCDFDDFLAVNNFFGEAGPDSAGDADGDGDCDFDDFLAVNNFFGLEAPGMAAFVPEPRTMVLLMLGVAVGGFRPKRLYPPYGVAS